MCQGVIPEDNIQLSPVAQLCSTLCDPMDCSTPGLPVYGLSQARIWSELSFSSPGDLPDPGIKPTSPTLAGRFFTAEPSGKPDVLFTLLQNSGKLYNQMHQNYLITQA